jgi:hypothetical protein
MKAAAVLYVGTLETMRAFYEQGFGLAVADLTQDYAVLVSSDWELMLVRSAEAVPVKTPAPRRENTPIKLAFDVTSIDALRPVIAGLGGISTDVYQRGGPIASGGRFRTQNGDWSSPLVQLP